MSTRQFALAVVVVCLGAMLAACHSSVRFQPHAPYNSPRRAAEPLIVVLPDDIGEVRESAHVGTMLRPRRFRVYYGEALQWETHARFANMFSGVFLVDQSAYDSIQTEEAREQMDMYSLPASLVEGRGYVLRLSNVRFQFEGGRALYLVDVSFSNRETGSELFRGNMRGRGTSVTVRDDTEFMSESLTQAVISANTSLLNPLAERMRRAIAEQPPPTPRAEPVAEVPVAEEQEASEEERQTAEPKPPPHPRLRPFFVTPE